MTRFWALCAGLSVALALGGAPDGAQAAKAALRAVARSCCRVPAGTVVTVELVDQVSTKVQKSGDSVALRLASPLVVNGRVVLRAGAPGVGEVIESAKPGLGGKAAKLVLAARYLTTRHGRLALEGLQMSGAGRDNSREAQAVGLTGIIFAPLGLVGMAVTGGDVVFPPGMSATAKVASAISLPSLGRARGGAASAGPDASQPVDAGSIDIPPPPAGEGQIVFFRRKSLLGTGQWFNVRENGKALGKLTNGSYFVDITTPGVHAYTATTEPELKDHLKLEVDPGETYFVEGTLTKGLVIGTADISPSSRERFVKASADLQLTPPPGEEKTAAASNGQAGNASAASAAQDAAASGGQADSASAASTAQDNAPGGQADSAPAASAAQDGAAAQGASSQPPPR